VKKCGIGVEQSVEHTEVPKKGSSYTKVGEEIVDHLVHADLLFKNPKRCGINISSIVEDPLIDMLGYTK